MRLCSDFISDGAGPVARAWRGSIRASDAHALPARIRRRIIRSSLNPKPRAPGSGGLLPSFADYFSPASRCIFAPALTGLFDALKKNPRLSHAEALQASLSNVISKPSKPEWAQPKFWASFVVVGEPQSVDVCHVHFRSFPLAVCRALLLVSPRSYLDRRR